MALARVRGCAGQVLLAVGGPPWQADASRRRNGPRKATSRRPITVRLRSKSCLDGEYLVPRAGRKAVVAIEAANPSAGGCGDEDQVGRASACHRSTSAEGGSRDGHYLYGQAHQRSRTFPQACRGQAGQAREARSEGDPGRRRGVEG